MNNKNDKHEEVLDKIPVPDENPGYEMVEDKRNQWELQEIVDDAVAAGEMNKYMRNEFLYEFKQGDRQVRGLTAAMYSQLALVSDCTVLTDETDWSESNEEFFSCRVIARKIDITGKDNHQDNEGFAEQPKFTEYKDYKTGEVTKKYDVFAKQKAYTKAKRNAFKTLLPFTIIMAAIEKLAFPKNANQQQQRQQALPPKTQNAQQAAPPNIETKRKEMFACFNEAETRLMNDFNIDKYVFGAGAKSLFNKISFTEFTAEEYMQVSQALREKPFPSWIQDLYKPTDKVKALAAIKEFEKKLPKTFWDDMFKKTGVKAVDRLAMNHWTMIWDHLKETFNLQTRYPDPEEVETVFEDTEGENTEGEAVEEEVVDTEEVVEEEQDF